MPLGTHVPALAWEALGCVLRLDMGQGAGCGLAATPLPWNCSFRMTYTDLCFALWVSLGSSCFLQSLVT